MTSATKTIFKLTSKELWDASQARSQVLLDSGDRDFIHFCEEDDIARIHQKFFAGGAETVLLRIDPSLLEGRLVKEKNPGGAREYFHLYKGGIPLAAVLEAAPYG